MSRLGEADGEVEDGCGDLVPCAGLVVVIELLIFFIVGLDTREDSFLVVGAREGLFVC